MLKKFQHKYERVLYFIYIYNTQIVYKCLLLIVSKTLKNYDQLYTEFGSLTKTAKYIS